MVRTPASQAGYASSNLVGATKISIMNQIMNQIVYERLDISKDHIRRIGHLAGTSRMQRLVHLTRPNL